MKNDRIETLTIKKLQGLIVIPARLSTMSELAEILSELDFKKNNSSPRELTPLLDQAHDKVIELMGNYASLYYVDD